MASCSAIRAFCWSAMDWVAPIFSSTAATCVLTYFSVAQPVTANAAARAAPTIQVLGLTAIIFVLSNQGPQLIRPRHPRRLTVPQGAGRKYGGMSAAVCPYRTRKD